MRSVTVIRLFAALLKQDRTSLRDSSKRSLFAASLAETLDEATDIAELLRGHAMLVSIA